MYGQGRGRGRKASLTVHSDGNALSEDEAILADEGGNLAERVELQVLGGGAARRDIDDLELEVVGLGHSLDGSGAGVTLLPEVRKLSSSGQWGQWEHTGKVYSFPKAILKVGGRFVELWVWNVLFGG